MREPLFEIRELAGVRVRRAAGDVAQRRAVNARSSVWPSAQELQLRPLPYFRIAPAAAAVEIVREHVLRRCRGAVRLRGSRGGVTCVGGQPRSTRRVAAADQRDAAMLDHDLYTGPAHEPILFEPPSRHSQVRHDGLGESAPRDAPRGEGEDVRRSTRPRAANETSIDAASAGRVSGYPADARQRD